LSGNRVDLDISGRDRKFQANYLAYRNLDPHHRGNARLAKVHGFSERYLAVARVNPNTRLKCETGMTAGIHHALRLITGELVLEVHRWVGVPGHIGKSRSGVQL
jgi:hypothetical protein